MVKQYEVLNWASSFLRKNNREEQVAHILLRHHLQMSRERFYMMMHEQIDETVAEKFKRDIERHALTGVPYQHLIGYEIFYDRKFSVNKHVLIPRQETEELVYHVIAENKDFPRPFTIVDVGTGSGIIAITLALEIPYATVYATDISDKALSIARKNALKLKANVRFMHGHFLKPLLKNDINIDIVVSNPPYIKQSAYDMLSDTVKNYDPHLALFASQNGLQAYDTILQQTTKFPSLKRLYFEIGYDQGRDVTRLVNSYFPNASAKVIQDINGKDRIVSANIL